MDLKSFRKEEWAKIPPKMCTNLVTQYKKLQRLKDCK